jgi:hypothetical protein
MEIRKKFVESGIFCNTTACKKCLDQKSQQLRMEQLIVKLEQGNGIIFEYK